MRMKYTYECKCGCSVYGDYRCCRNCQRALTHNCACNKCPAVCGNSKKVEELKGEQE